MYIYIYMFMFMCCILLHMNTYDVFMDFHRSPRSTTCQRTLSCSKSTRRAWVKVLEAKAMGLQRGVAVESGQTLAKPFHS